MENAHGESECSPPAEPLSLPPLLLGNRLLGVASQRGPYDDLALYRLEEAPFVPCAVTASRRSWKSRYLPAGGHGPS
ncbi:hypothetical protein BE17_30280 [Sorangium cellulosum]|uniref:Uncharacterized protein n=1 Tax=Sorangium cellulosum TaxID=56 RepID=A0A150RQQ1_SORCE|nr:hypothetical protein BE17_30280 [Sorangium cellulosum]